MLHVEREKEAKSAGVCVYLQNDTIYNPRREELPGDSSAEELDEAPVKRDVVYTREFCQRKVT